MIEWIESADPQTLGRFDDVIDVRSPLEFEEDHIPGAVNLPVLDDAQRAEVGTLYVQSSKFLARRVGAALVSRNVAIHLERFLADKTGSYRPLIYCWRGGQRSQSMALVLDQVGWRITVLRGGYRTYRRRVTGALYDERAPLQFVVISGGTGSGKTEVLTRAASQGAQIVNLEALARHRGSLFGAMPDGPQPSQKLFETRLLREIETLDLSRPILVEDESSRIGDLFLPPSVTKAMARAPRIELLVSPRERARYIAAAYGDIALDVGKLAETLNALPRHHSLEEKGRWRSLAGEGDLEALALALIEAHYDPAYARSAARSHDRGVAQVSLSDLSAEALDAAAAEVVRIARTLA